MMPHINTFAISVYEAYKTSLLEILESSLSFIDVEQEKLSYEFTAFSAGAFVHAHESSKNLSNSYATSNLQEILTSSIQPIIFEFGKERDIESNEYTKDLFETSFITGETSLNDQEIFEIIKKRPLNEFNSNQPSISTLTIDENEISDFSVKRNKFFIDTKIYMINGSDLVYRIKTNFSKTLDLDHDRQFLLPASHILAKEYNFTIPQVPHEEFDDISKFEFSLIKCRENLDLGRSYLLDYFLKKSKEISEDSSKNEFTISDRFSVKYTRALNTLKKALPFFIDDVQSFVSEAMPTN